MTASMTAKSAATVESDDMQMSDIGIKYYGAPELKLVPGSSKYSINCEVYAFGVILLEIVFLRKVTAAIQCFPSRLNDPKFGIPEFLQVLISQCLDAKHPERRPSFDVIFKTLLFQVQTVKQCMDGNHQFDNEESASEMNMLSSGLYYGQQSSAMKSWFSTTISSIKKGSNDYKKQKTSDDRISSIEELNTSADSAINPIVTTKFSAKTSKASSNAGRTHVQRNAIVRPSMTSSQKRKCTNRYILPGVILGLVVIAVSVIAAVMVSRSSAASSGNSSNANDIKSGGSSTNGNNNSSNNNSSSSSSSSPWTGVSSFDLFSFSADKQTQVITNLAAIGVKYIRIYIKSTTRGDYPLNDVEPIKLGVYDDKILTYIDHTMALVQAAGMKLIITLHDRFAFGCDLTDAYTTVLNIKAPCDPADASTDAFYTNASMIAAFEARLGHILSHRNARLSNQPWSQLNSVIYAVDIQSSAEYALSAGYNLNSSSWLCDRAKTLRNSILGGASNPILISTGPGPEMSLSLRTSIFSCNAIDLIGVGDETATDEGSFESAVKSKLAAAVSLGKQYSKQIVFEDFNSGGYSPAEYIKLAQQYGLPWVIWEVSYGGTTAYNPSDFYIQNTYMWNLIKNNSKK